MYEDINSYTACSSFIMQKDLFDEHVRQTFKSTFNLLLHFLISLLQLVSATSIFGLQIALTISQTCAFRLGIGFWTYPFLVLSPVSIWLVIWRRNSTACFLAIFIHFLSNIFATSILIVGFLVLIDRIGFVCPSTSFNTNLAPLNSSLMISAAFFKLFTYGELMSFYIVLRNRDQIETIIIEEYQDEDNHSLNGNKRIHSDHLHLPNRSDYKNENDLIHV